jgi:hypothetical protein
VIYSMWYDVSRLLSVGVKDVARLVLHTEHIALVAALRASDRQLSRDIILHAVNRSLALLRMGKELPETCLANLKINKLLLLHLVGHLIYLCPYTVYM